MRWVWIYHHLDPLAVDPEYRLLLGELGPDGIFKSEDGRPTWHCATTPRNTSLVSAADPLHVWAGGEDRLTQSTALYTDRGCRNNLAGPRLELAPLNASGGDLLELGAGRQQGKIFFRQRR